MNALLRFLVGILYPRAFAQRFGEELEWVCARWCADHPRNALYALFDVVATGIALRAAELRGRAQVVLAVVILGLAAGLVDLEETRFLPPFFFTVAAAALVSFPGFPGMAVLVGMLVPLAHALAPSFGYVRSPEWTETIAAVVPAAIGALVGTILRRGDASVSALSR